MSFTFCFISMIIISKTCGENSGEIYTEAEDPTFSPIETTINHRTTSTNSVLISRITESLAATTLTTPPPETTVTNKTTNSSLGTTLQTTKTPHTSIETTEIPSTTPTTTLPGTTTPYAISVDYNEECKKIFPWSAHVDYYKPLYSVPCHFYCRVDQVKKYEPHQSPDFVACEGNKRCLRGNCVKTPSPEEDHYCRLMMPRRRVLAIRDIYLCKMLCYDLDYLYVYEVRVRNGSACRLVNKKEGVCNDGECEAVEYRKCP
ncbi:uncharacterized protein LOC111632987 isoform X2 [Centruroides sculpturatus]|uniref:uncharacterized protein LOC111632987 isoform X1 n=1 Tax=Centruroides sculpturatus TaxID=218467 RepID=UPI000C6D0DD5|nr:uncharacterized protein LOC111632987 isoform X1 [Centruroides sculpturatus]XP_023233280.1 uncharacterized protein LOC111632987 isoform X2 [Centruroides sculpturatus]